MLLRRVCSMLCSLSLCLLIASCSLRGKPAAQRSVDAGNSSGVPTVLPLAVIPKKIHRRYVNYAGAEAFIYRYQDRTSVLTRWNGLGPFQYVPFTSTTDPIVLPLPNGQAVIASKDQIMLRHGCPEIGCAFNEIIKAPSNDPPVGLDAIPVADGSEPTEVLMVNGTSSIYTLDLLERAWRTTDALPNGVGAVAIKSTTEMLFVIDQRGKQLLMKTSAENVWRFIPVPTSAEETIQGITISNGYLVLSSGSKVRIAALRQLRSTKSPATADTQVNWREISSPDTNSILQISADGSKLYCTTVLGDTYQLDAAFLSTPDSSKRWFLFTPSGNLPIGSEQIQNATAIDGELLAFTAGGVAHSANDGVAWIHETASEDKDGRLDEVEYGISRYAITADGLLKKDAPSSAWRHINPSAGVCRSGDSNDDFTLRGDHLLKIDDQKLLLVFTVVSNGTNIGCLFNTQDGSVEPLTKGWQRSADSATFVAIHSNLLAATQAGVELWLPSEHRWTDPTETSGSHSQVLPKNVTAAAPYGSDGIIVATSSGSLYHADFIENRLGDWTQVGDNQQQLVKNLSTNFGRVVAIWVNPNRLSEIYLLANQNGAAWLYSRDKTDSFFLFADQKPDVPLKFVSASDGSLFTVGTTQFNRVLSNRPPPGSFQDFEQRFGEKIQNWVKEPVSWITGFLGTYVIAVLCVLTLRYFPRNPILGRNWLASFIVKPFTILPWSGRWALFLGYRKRLLRTVKRDGPYFGLPALMPSGKTVPPDGSGMELLDTILGQVSGTRQLVLTGRPGAGKSMLLARIAQELVEPGPKTNKWLPVVITSDDYNGDLVASTSKVLKERFGIPLDKEDLLLAQMQVGGILVLFDGLSEVSTSRAAAVADLQRVSRMPEFSKCALLVATRSFKGGPGFPECQVLPVSGQEAVANYLPLFPLESVARQRVENNLLGFGDEPIDVQLLAMTIEASDAKLNQQRHEIFVSFFRKRLSAEGDDSNDRWEGLRLALELIAKAFCVDTGVKSVGLSPRALIDSIQVASASLESDLGGKDLLSELRDTYGPDYPNAAALLDYLKGAGILIRIERWKFAHDTFEEFFCASYLVRRVKTHGHLPELFSWKARPQEFREVFDFFYEMADQEVIASLTHENLPAAWQSTANTQAVKPSPV